jgi:hypothetical protein
MSSSAQLKLGDIIQIEAKNQDLNNRVYVIDYLDETKLRLIDAETILPRTLTINPETGSFSDESIFNINILDHAPEPGYARQNGLLPNTWVDIYFGGEHPTVITGRISNLEDGEDMIELTIVPDNEVIYIDFGFKGVPEHLPIERINIRPPPSAVAAAAAAASAAAAATDAATDVVSPNVEAFDDGLAPPMQTVSVAVPAVRNAIAEMLHDADEIMASQAVQEFSFMVDVPAERKRYTLESQTNDLLNALLSAVPATRRTDSVLNGIHTLITRFKQLREQFSTFDRSGNAHAPLTQGPDHRPLIDTLRKMNQRLYWILPVAACRKKTYVNEEAGVADDVGIGAGVGAGVGAGAGAGAGAGFVNISEDVMQTRMAQTLAEQSELHAAYKAGADSYAAYMNKLSAQQFTPFVPPEYEDDYMVTQAVRDNLEAVIDNLGELKSSVVAGKELKTRRFVMQRYNLGLTRLNAISISANRMTANVVPMTPPDSLTLKSFIMLPEPAVSFSRINLHTINVLDKSLLNQHNLNYWQLLRKTTRISTRTIDDMDEHIAFNSRDFLSDVKEYVFSSDITDADRYAEYLRIVVPRTRVLFDLVKKHLVGSLTLSEIVNYLEPFMVYHRDLTYRQYTDMVGFLRERIRDHKRNYALLKAQSDKVRAHNYGVTHLGISLMYNLLVSGKAQQEDAEAAGSSVFETYGFSKEQYNIDGDTAFQRADAADAELRLRRALTPSELMHRMLVADNARLYTCAIARLNLDLITNFDFAALLNQQTAKFKQRKAEEEGANKCANIVIAKQYLADSDELEDDNGINIAFDRKFDRTKYDFIAKYATQQQEMPREEFILFLKEEIKRELKVPDDRQAGVEAEAMLLGERPVQDGQYAVIEMDNADGTNRSLYYVRKNKRWIRDTNIPMGVSMHDPAFFCNVQEKCFTVEQTCMDYDLAADAVKEGLLDEMNAEFKASVNESRERTVQRITGKLNYYDTVLPRLRHMKYARMTKYNDAQLRHQVSADDFQDILQSPYERLKTIILGQTDIVKRSADVLNFVERYTRGSNERLGEDPHWLYCVKTDVKLLPAFLRRLAAAFMASASTSNPSSYQSVLRTVCREQGEISDEGNAIVDKYSGYVIMLLESATEEGSDFRGALDVDEGEGALTATTATATTAKSTVPKKYDNPRAVMISNVVTSMGNYLHVDLSSLREFIVEKTMATLNATLKSEEQYNRAAQAYFEKEKKRLPAFKDSLHQSLLLYALTFLTVAVQTAIPSLKTNKTQPGCVRSFLGYPLLGEEDMSGIRYVACIAYQLKSKSVEPWSAIKDMKEAGIADKIKLFMNKYAVTNGEIGDLLALKREYLAVHADELVPVELDIRRMTTFLPPLGGVVNPTTNQVSPQFMERLDDNLRRGKPEQTEQLGVLRAKVMYFALGIQQLVQEVVSKHRTQLLLRPQTEGGVPFLQNACCLEGVDSTTLDFFVRQRPGIRECDADAAKTQAVIDRIVQLGQAATLYDPTTSKSAFPALPPQFDERTIYMAFIAFCNYNNLRPVPPQLQLFCLNKPAPDEFSASDPVTTQIERLKRRGVNFTRDAFMQLLQAVCAHNVLPVHLDKPAWSSDQQLRDMLAELQAKTQGIIPDELQAHVLAIMDTYDLALSEETPEMREFKSYLSNLCDDRWAQIGSFLDAHRANVPNFSRQRTKLKAVFGTLMDFAPQKRGSVIESDDATLNRAVQFTKNCMHSLAQVFPGMISHQVQRDANSIKVPAHWGLSDGHREDVRNIIARTCAGLHKFYGDRQLASLLAELQRRVRVLMHFMSVVPFFAEITPQQRAKTTQTTQTATAKATQTTTFSVFDNRTVHLLYKYFFLELLAEHTRMVDYEGVIIEETVPVEEDEQVAATLRAEEAAAEGLGIVEEVQFLQMERTVVGKTIVELLFAYADIVDDERAAVDMNADTIKERVRRTKDKEKELIVESFDGMTKDQREIEKFFKDHRMGDWNVGMQKGLRQYVGDTYDREREEMEQQLRKERQLNRRDFVSAMQREIFLDGDAEREAAQIEAEEYSLRSLPADDDYGDADDGGALEYEDVNQDE